MCCLWTVWTFTGTVLPYVEERDDKVVISDRLLDAFPVKNTSTTVNIIMYSSTLFFILCDMWWWQLLPSETWLDMVRPLNSLLLTFTLFYWFRSVLLLSCPLHHHPQMRPLEDTIVQWITGSDQAHAFLHDLMCSGHVSTLMIFLLHSEVPWLYAIGIALTIYSFCWSKVHYMIDCLVAPPVVYSVYSLAQQLLMCNKT